MVALRASPLYHFLLVARRVGACLSAATLRRDKDADAIHPRKGAMRVGLRHRSFTVVGGLRL